MRLSSLLSCAVAVLFNVTGRVRAAELSLSVDSGASIKTTARAISQGLLSYYHGNETGETPGILPSDDYYWYLGGAMWSGLIDYWHYTGDGSYNELITQGLLWQLGERKDFLPANVTAQAGNDDQGTWALAAMAAAEYGFPDPPKGQPQWADVATTVFNELASRWDKQCGGGLRWQIYKFNSGYDYKNSISNGMLFNLAARLARYTGNQTYADWADKSWSWMENVGLLDKTTYAIYDGAKIEDSCSQAVKTEWSRDNAIYLLGSATMYNTTNGDAKWKNRVDKLVSYGLKHFFKDSVAYEAACESVDTCQTDMKLFKGLLHQWYSSAIKMAPYISDQVLPVLKKSASAGVKECNGGEDGRACGFHWLSGKFDKKSSAVTEMSVLSAVSGLLVQSASAPLVAGASDSTNSSGGTEGNGKTGHMGDGGNGTHGAAGGNSSSQKGDDDSAGFKRSVHVNSVVAVSLLLAMRMI